MTNFTGRVGHVWVSPVALGGAKAAKPPLAMAASTWRRPSMAAFL